jgi:hypothetical protein
MMGSQKTLLQTYFYWLRKWILRRFLRHRLELNVFGHTFTVYFIYVSTDLDYCQTLHIMDSTGSSVIVNKKCANRTECHPSTVGCLSIDRQTVRTQLLLLYHKTINIIYAHS